MANNVNTNPIYIDTFTSDVTIFSNPVSITAIYFETDTNTDILVLEDLSGNVVYRLPITANTIDAGTNYNQPTGKWVIFPKESPLIANSLVMIASNGNYDGTCYAIIKI